MMLEGAGFEMVDLAQTLRQRRSSVRTRAHPRLWDERAADDHDGADEDHHRRVGRSRPRGSLKIMIGGAPVTDAYAKQMAPTPMRPMRQPVDIARSLVA